MSETYSQGYFNIEDILASQERVSCKFDIEIANMGLFFDEYWTISS
jgi:hypothetical protein